MRIAELFESIQGEGQFAGTPSVFVRTTGCNLRCWFCDTPYTSWRPEGGQRCWESVFDDVCARACAHVVVTGGEPLLQPEVVPLTRALVDAGKHVTIETAGTVFRPVTADLMSISPKLANSTPDDAVWSARHDRLRDRAETVRRIISQFPYQLKFVIDRREDLEDVRHYLDRFPEVPADHVWLMPQAATAEAVREKTAWLDEAAARCGFRVSPRLHIELFGNVPGR